MSFRPRWSSALGALAVWALAVATGSSAAGCAIGNQRFGVVLDPALIPQIKIGTSTKQDVLDLFGPPTNYSRIPATADMALQTTDQEWRARFPIEAAKAAEDVFVYEYREEEESFFSVFLFTYFSRDTLTDRLMVFFGPGDVVKYLAFAKQTDTEFERPEDE